MRKRFQKLEVLSDDNKKQIMTNLVTTDPQGGFGGQGFSGQDFSGFGGGGFEDIFSSFFGGSRQRDLMHQEKVMIYNIQ